MKTVRNVTRWWVLGLLLGLLVVWPGEGLAQEPENNELNLAVSSALIKQRSQITNNIGVFSVKYVDKWAFGLATIGVQTEGGGPDGYLFIAQESETGWKIAIESSAQFREWIAEAPDKLVSEPEKSVLIGRQSRGDGSAQLGLPWQVGETWRLTGGPHSNNGSGSRPWSALDFAGGSMLVRASADGTVYVGCLGAFIRVTHANGWQTGHYHIENPQVSSGQTVKRGDVLGTAGTAAPQISGCRGGATGAHVHYSLRRNNVHQEISGHDIGGWTVSETAHYDGCMTKNGVRKCDYYSGSGREIYNDGTVGSIPVTPPPPTDGEIVVEDPTLTPNYSSGCSGWARLGPNNRGHYFYLTLNATNISQSTHSATWRPNISKGGQYKVEAFIAQHSGVNWNCGGISGWRGNDTTKANYTIHHAGGMATVVRNQFPLNNEWLDLGTYSFDTGTNGYVKLTDLTGETPFASRTVSFSAVKFTCISGCDPSPTNKRVGIEAGHSDSDPGSFSCDGQHKEADNTIAVANLTAQTLRAKGYTVDIFRAGDAGMKGYQADAFISLHNDFCPAGYVSGFKTSRFKGQAGTGINGSGDASDRLVQTIWSEYAKATGLPKDTSPGHFTTNMLNYYALDSSKGWIASSTPGAIIEMAWWSGDEDMLLNHRDVLATGVANSILAFFGDDPPPPTAEYSHWTFNEGTGSSANDQTSNANHGTVQGASWVNGKVGKALQFDGADDYVEIPHSDSLNLNSAMTIAAWVKPTSLCTDNNAIVQKDSSYGLKIKRDKPLGFIWSAYEDHVAEEVLYPNNWFHLAGTFENGEHRVYIDGVLVSQGTDTMSTIPTANMPLYIGKGSYSCNFAGIIDEVYLYNRALTGSEIKSLCGNCSYSLPVAPSNLQVTNRTQGSITISWQDNSDNETGFTVRHGGLWSYTTTANQTAYTITNLVCGRDYRFYVQSFNNHGESKLVGSLDATTLDCSVNYNIVGQVTDQNDNAIADVTISTDTGQQSTTNNVGMYNFTLPEGSYTLTPSKSGYSFSPASVSIDLSEDKVQNFKGILSACGLPVTPNFTEAYGTVKINTLDAPAGALVEAVSPRGEVVGCFTVTSSGQYGSLRIYGEDATVSPVIPGMRAGETVSFRVNGQPATATPTLTWQNDKTSHQINLNVSGSQQQTIALTPGWNLISFNVEPTDPTVAAVLTGLSYSRVLGDGGSFVPTLPPSFNSLKELHPGQAYYIYSTASSNTNLVVAGIPVAANTPISLKAGWNWLGYLPQTTLPIAEALNSISGNYQRVIDIDGTYSSSLPPQFNTLTEMAPGRGYLIFMNNAATLTYPATGGRLASLATSPEKSCQLNPTPYLTLIYGDITLNGQPAPVGTQVDIVSPNGLVSGCFTVQQAGVLGLTAVYGYDEATGVDGFRLDEPLSFRVQGQTVATELSWQDDREPHFVILELPSKIYLPLIVR